MSKARTFYQLNENGEPLGHVFHSDSPSGAAGKATTRTSAGFRKENKERAENGQPPVQDPNLYDIFLVDPKLNRMYGHKTSMMDLPEEENGAEENEMDTEDGKKVSHTKKYHITRKPVVVPMGYVDMTKVCVSG